jgi:hypothetical protein
MRLSTLNKDILNKIVDELNGNDKDRLFATSKSMYVKKLKNEYVKMNGKLNSLIEQKRNMENKFDLFGAHQQVEFAVFEGEVAERIKRDGFDLVYKRVKHLNLNNKNQVDAYFEYLLLLKSAFRSALAKMLAGQYFHNNTTRVQLTNRLKKILK